MPRPTWRVRAAGPAGTSYLMAVVSPVARDFTREMNSSGQFAYTAANAGSARNLVAAAAGGNAPGGRIGVSEVQALREVP